MAVGLKVGSIVEIDSTPTTRIPTKNNRNLEAHQLAKPKQKMVRLIFRMVPTIDTLGEHDHLPWLLSAAVWRWFTVNCSVGRETGSINSSLWGSCFFSNFWLSAVWCFKSFFFPMTLRLTTKIASEYRNTGVSPLMGIHGEIGEIYLGMIGWMIRDRIDWIKAGSPPAKWNG